MVKAILRTKSIGTKVTEEEYARLDELATAACQSRAEWVRTILLDRLEREGTEETMLAELLGLRTILLNLLFTTAKGETMTPSRCRRSSSGPTPASWSGRGNYSLLTLRRRRWTTSTPAITVWPRAGSQAWTPVTRERI
jgi:hypothetical protein